MAMETTAPGFVDLAHLADRRVIEAGWQIVNDAVLQSAVLHTVALNQIMGQFVKPIDPTKPRFKFRLPVATEMQPLQGEDDNPTPTRGFDEYEVAFPLRDSGFAWGDNRKSRVKMTVAEANDLTLVGLQADTRWNRRHLLSAIFEDTGYNFADDEFGTLAVKGLANGDTDKYNNVDGEVYIDTHYLAQANAIDDSNNPFDDIYDELVEHPTNQGEVIVYIPTNLKATVEALAGFVPYYENRRVQPGSSSDILSDFPSISIGDKRLGMVNDCYIVEWKAMPSSYMLSHTTGGGQFVGRREEPEAELQGLRVELFTPDGNHQVRRLLRTAGYGVLNRIAAVVYRVGNGTYAPPSGYEAPAKI